MEYGADDSAQSVGCGTPFSSRLMLHCVPDGDVVGGVSFEVTVVSCTSSAPSPPDVPASNRTSRIVTVSVPVESASDVAVQFNRCPSCPCPVCGLRALRSISMHGTKLVIDNNSACVCALVAQVTITPTSAANHHARSILASWGAQCISSHGGPAFISPASSLDSTVGRLLSAARVAVD